ncbi:MAG: NUDIX hydrolase [Candidatus Nanohalobium sp.]
MTIPVAKVLIQNQEDKFLAVKEKDSGKWELPGGCIEKDEDRFQAAKREIREELGIKITGLQDVVRIELEDDRKVNCYMIHVESFDGKPEPREELTETRWVTAGEFKDMNWHLNAGYNIPVMKHLEEYLEKENNY